MTFQNFLKRSFYPSVFDDLEELFIYIWWKIHRDGDTLRLIKRKWLRFQFLMSYTDKVFIKLKENYIDHFGMSDKHKQYYSLIRRIHLHESDLAVTGNRWNIGQIMILEAQLKELTKGSEDSDEYETILDVQMALGGNVKLDPLTTSVIAYGAAEKKAQKIAKQQRLENNARKAKLNGRKANK